MELFQNPGLYDVVSMILNVAGVVLFALVFIGLAINKKYPEKAKFIANQKGTLYIIATTVLAVGLMIYALLHIDWLAVYLVGLTKGLVAIITLWFLIDKGILHNHKTDELIKSQYGAILYGLIFLSFALILAFCLSATAIIQN